MLFKMKLWLLLFSLMYSVTGLSFNQPSLSPCAMWNTSAVTFANSDVPGVTPFDIFINTQNTVYAPPRLQNKINVGYGSNLLPNRSITGGLSKPYTVFVTDDNREKYYHVDKWTYNASNGTPVMYVNGSCYSLFVDINITLYCSLGDFHQVIKQSLTRNNNRTILAAGNGVPGFGPNMLRDPRGIYVDGSLQLYVADCSNNRVQLFRSNPYIGKTIVGNGSSIGTSLNCPTSITLDNNGSLFIVDSNNNRIIVVGLNGIWCLVGCSSTDSAADQLSTPKTLSFDTVENMFVTDWNNNRIQKFNLVTHFYNVSTTATTDGITTVITLTLTTTLTSTSTRTRTTTTSNYTTTASTTTTQTATTTTTSQSSVTFGDCLPPNITLSLKATQQSVPMDLYRSENIYISSYIDWQCGAGSALTTQWTVTKWDLYGPTRIQLMASIMTNLSELFIPEYSLDVGTYEMTLTAALTTGTSRSTSVSTFIRINRANVVVNLVPSGTSMISQGVQFDLTLSPGRFSVDPDSPVFNASNWNYKYYCRIYNQYDFPTLNGSRLEIDDPRMSQLNTSCVSNLTGNDQSWRYDGVSTSPTSTLTLLAGSLRANQTYQFMAVMSDHQNASIQFTGYVLVRVEVGQPQMLVVGCVIPMMCISQNEYQYVNPTSQLALYSGCVAHCQNTGQVTWNIYQGSFNATTNITTWIPLNQTNLYRGIYFFGLDTSNLTITRQLFADYSATFYWKFEVIYSSGSQNSSSAMNVMINSPPQGRSCSVNPLNGSIDTLFTISCANWSDTDGIQGYSLYGWTSNPLDRVLLTYSLDSTFQLFLPNNQLNRSQLSLTVGVRDRWDSVTEMNISSVMIESSSTMMNQTFSRSLLTANQNRINQIILSFSQQFNAENRRDIADLSLYGISTLSLDITTLDGSTFPFTGQTNSTAVNEYLSAVNSRAAIRDVLIESMLSFGVTTSENIQLQASTLAQLTSMTNELTRKTIKSASKRCYQLALALNSMVEEISFEDLQQTMGYILQCTSQVSQAVHSSLQQHQSVLDLDFTRANELSDDYETDIEQDWSDLNLFAEDNDFSWSTIAKNRNTYYQKQLAKTIDDQVTQVIDLVTETMKIHLNIDQKYSINTSSIYFAMEASSIGSLSNKSIELMNALRIQLPSNLTMNISETQSIITRSIIFPFAVSDDSLLKSATNLSRSLSLTIFDSHGNEIPVQTSNSSRIELIISRDPNLSVPPMTLQNVTGVNQLSNPHRQIYNLHYVNLTRSKWNENRTFALQIEIGLINVNLAYVLIYRFDQSPQLNSSIHQIDGWTSICPSNQTIFRYFLNNEQTGSHQSVIFGLREMNSSEMIDYCSFNRSNSSPPITDEPFRFTDNYQLRTYTASCYYLDSNNVWQTDGLIVGPMTSHQQTQCFSNHLTTFAGGFLVLPAPINWNYVFANANFAQNKTIYLTVIITSILFVLCMIYARYEDRQDLQKLGVTPLPDNNPVDEYFYQILVFTGHRKAAGTKSKVSFVISGDEDETRIRLFADPQRAIFQRGGIDAFIMSVPKALGRLNYMRVWHDNSGPGASASWFLKYIIVRDLQTLEKSYFLNQGWLAVEKDDGRIDRVLPVAGEADKQNFSYVLSKKAYHSLSEGHLWFSIFNRPASNRFTRVQRCTACFVLLFTSMLLNILYYDQAQDAQQTKTTASLTLGSLYITLEQIVIGVIVEVLCFVPSILLVELFRRTKNRNQNSPLEEAFTKLQHKQAMPEMIIKKQTKKWMFPWWCLIVAYILSFLLYTLSTFFIIVRGIQFGDLKTQKWLTSLVSGFFSSILLIQPLKILVLAVFFAFACRQSDRDEEAAELIDDDLIEMNRDDEEYLHSQQNLSPFHNGSTLGVRQLTEHEILWAREERLKEIRMWEIIREISTYFAFVILLYFSTYSNVSQFPFYQVRHLQHYFLQPNHIGQDFTQMVTIDDYWSWLETSFVDNIRAQIWYNNIDPPRNLSGYINDKTNRLIGWPILRQIRVQNDSCKTNIVEICHNDFSWFNEEKNSFSIGWINETTDQANTTVGQAFQYRSGNDVESYSYITPFHTYPSGGYVYELRGRLDTIRTNLSELRRQNWIDSGTRAVFLEFSLYNPNVQLFTAVTLLIELLPTGGVFPSYSFEPLSFVIFTSLSQLICAILYMLLIVDLMIGEIRSLIKLKWKHFQLFWSWINAGIVICSWTGLSVYLWRYFECNRILNLFKETNGYVYINLQLATYINGLLIYSLGYCCFFATVRFLRLCRFHRRLCLFAETIRHARAGLISFSMMFSFIFMAFLSLFYLLFLDRLESCATLLNTAQMLFEMMLMKFDVHQLKDAAAFLGPFCFTLFILIIVFVCMNMFVSIIMESFRYVREQLKKAPNRDQEVLMFMIRRIQCVLGLRRQHTYEEQEANVRATYHHPIETFPRKVDQLFVALDRIYQNQVNVKA